MGLNRLLINPDMFSVASGQVNRRIHRFEHRSVDWSRMPIEPEEFTKSTEASVNLPTAVEEERQANLTEKVARSHHVAALFARKVFRISSLEGVYVSEGEGGFEIWVVGNNISKDEKHALYDAKWSFISEQPEIDIHVELVDRRNRPLADVISVQYFDGSASLAVLRRRKNA